MQLRSWNILLKHQCKYKFIFMLLYMITYAYFRSYFLTTKCYDISANNKFVVKYIVIKNKNMCYLLDQKKF